MSLQHKGGGGVYYGVYGTYIGNILIGNTPVKMSATFWLCDRDFLQIGGQMTLKRSCDVIQPIREQSDKISEMALENLNYRVGKSLGKDCRKISSIRLKVYPSLAQ